MPTVASVGVSCGAKGSTISLYAPGWYSAMKASMVGMPTRWQKAPKASSCVRRCALYMAKMGSIVCSSSESFILKMDSTGWAVRSAWAGCPPSHSWYMLGPEPTKASSAMYGRAHPLGQPVVRVTKSVLPSPISLSCCVSRALMLGCTRSASVMARPHRGNAGHAIDLRVRASTSSISLMPCIRRQSSTPCRSAARMLRSTTDCEGVSSRSTPGKLSTIARSPDLIRISGVSRTRPCSMFTPSMCLPSPWSCQPIQSMYFHSGSGRHGSKGSPRYFSVSVRKSSMPRVCTKYLSRALERTSRLPWSRCTARMAFIASKKTSLRTYPRCDAARANVASFLCARPMPPPTTMLKPASVSPSASMMTTHPMSLMYKSTPLSPGTVKAILNFFGRYVRP
mmetsp:Transcript_33213/g.77638  ORF Transcript_33213/g.77638 Transcript_33213/m.77638 type:complete len:395 (+) Transcript_33213:381-1565(+)